MAEKEDDEVYVVVELTGVIDSQVMELAGKECTILGIDTPQPVLKLGSYLFTGEYKDTIGTCVLFEECEAETNDEAGRTSCVARARGPKNKQLKYLGKTEKRLDMKTSFLREKAAVRAAELLQSADASAQGSSASFLQEKAVAEAAESLQPTDAPTPDSLMEMAVDDG
uniref:Proteinral transcription factor n=1 Tax=Amblyomma triste TaxID=251400 RepID=A0A023GFA1_AMBTT